MAVKVCIQRKQAAEYSAKVLESVEVSMKIRKCFREIISLSMVLVLCIMHMPNKVYAQVLENDVEYVNVYDAGMERKVQIGIKSSDIQGCSWE